MSQALRKVTFTYECFLYLQDLWVKYERKKKDLERVKLLASVKAFFKTAISQAHAFDSYVIHFTSYLLWHSYIYLCTPVSWRRKGFYFAISLVLRLRMVLSP